MNKFSLASTARKALKEEPYQVHTYNFDSKFDEAAIESMFIDLVDKLNEVLEEIDTNMSYESRIFKRLSSQVTKLDEISDNVLKILADYKKEGKGGTYLKKVEDPDIIAQINKLSKGK